MEVVMEILRSMQPFDYAEFRQELEAQKLSSGQKAMLNLRLGLLDACLKGGNKDNRVAMHFQEGKLTIVEYGRTPS
jgi:tryptophan 2,3-dioxygenase